MTLRLVGLVVCGLILNLASGISAQDRGSFPRPLAAGVLKAFAPQIDARDTFSVPMAMPELQAQEYQGNLTAQAETLRGSTRDIVFFRNVWQLEFATLGLRQIKLSFKAPDGAVQNRHYWYLVYRVRNLGESISYDQVKQDVVFPYVLNEVKLDAAKEQPELLPRTFQPTFELTGWVADAKGEYSPISYRDQFLPLVAKEIQKLEDPNQRLFNSLEIGDIEIPLSRSESDPGVWGVAVWEEVDPRVNYVSIRVKGLTNAYRIVATADGKIDVVNKMLQLNYWRPGDGAQQDRDFVSYGIPYTDGHAEQVAITKRYALPGPQILAYQVNELADREVHVTEVDAEVDVTDFSSPVVAALDDGKLPESLINNLKLFGYQVSDSTAVTQVIDSSMWQFQVDVEGKKQKWVLKFEPQYWEQDGKAIRFLKSLDHLWIYQ
ncbi:MAG: hypothetical protein ACK49R_13430 [Planctomycetota bacterium]